MKNKIIPVIIIILLLITVIIAVTQEYLFETGDFNEEELHYSDDFEFTDDFNFEPKPPKPVPGWVHPIRWFRSNRGGMAIQEVQSRLVALRNEYALAILFAEEDVLPDYLLPYYNDDFYIEIRTLYEDGEQIRTQWIFKDINATVRLIAVFTESDEIPEIEYEIERIDIDIPEIEVEVVTVEEKIETEMEIEDDKEYFETAEEDIDEELEKQYEEEQVIAEIRNNAHENINISGFIEIYDENSFLITEYRFNSDGTKRKMEYNFSDNLLLSTLVLEWKDDEAGGLFTEFYEDFYRYNRSYYLRGIERKFYKDGVIPFSQVPTVIAFPLQIMDADQINYFMGDRLNPYPEFFGIFEVKRNNKIIYTADDRGRILNQTLYDEEDNVIWVIYNAWQGERITLTRKIEGDTELSAEYEYDSAGDRITERNIRNGNLERVVRTEGKIDIEELYINNVVVLRAVWDDGRKVSETRTTRQ